MPEEAEVNVGIENTVVSLLRDEKQLADLMASIEKKKEKIQQYFDKQGVKQVTVQVQNREHTRVVEFVARKFERTSITYDIDALKKKLDKEMLNEVIKKKYSIVDFDGVVKLLKEYSVPAVEFKKFIEVTPSVDTKSIKLLYDAGELTLEKLRGCYTAKITKTIDVKRLE